MSDNNEEKKRPNANYKLSGQSVDENNLVFHYSRERRLAKAPQAVRDMYNKSQQPHRFNLIRPLVRTKPLAMMFASIIIICVFILVISALGLAGSSYNLDGNRVSIQAIQYEGATIVAVKKTIPKDIISRLSSAAAPYTGAVDIAVQPIMKTDADQNPQAVFYHKIFFTFEPEEIYRFSVPFDTKELAVVFQTEQKTLGVTVKAE
jgi:hypothetical protein